MVDEASEQIRIRLTPEEKDWLSRRADGGRPNDWTHKIRSLIQEERRREEEGSELYKFGEFLKKHQERAPEYKTLASAITQFCKRKRQ